MRLLIYTRLSMMQGGLPDITNHWLKRHRYSYIVQPLSLPQIKVLFEDSSRSVSPIGSKESPKCKHIGTRPYRPSRATPAQSGPWPSRPTASRSSLDPATRQYGSGTPLQEHRCRRS